MLQIENVRKKYVTGELEQTALDGVSLGFRESELVAILGPSGSGKSTLLNVIGGLDRYDSGDLIIDGISTKKYSDRDWDSYRNHTVGFVFQSYNLIPHQSVLANVELALTISGISRKERQQRAVEALEKVGLGEQLHKKPSQMSGGQMQRVAIARALVNNPRILLADEPTGALDSETSVQVMELIKEVSRDRLVIMVTHNPELADLYADRIVRVRDGQIVDDTNPPEPEPQPQEPPRHQNMGKSSMSLLAALGLSFNNLKSKKGRTLLTAFAGSIGIIGIALILAISVGFQSYVDEVQADTLANNPLSLQSQTANLMSMFMPPQDADSTEPAQEQALEQPALRQMLGNFGSNDLAAFKAHLESNWDSISKALSSVQYYYNITPRIYAPHKDGFRQINPACLFKTLTGNPLVSAMMDVNVFQQIPDDEAMLSTQYDVLKGRWPEDSHEVIFVLPQAGVLSDHIAYTLGMKDLKSLEDMIDLLVDDKNIPPEGETGTWSYDEMLNMEFQLVNVPELYEYNEEYKIWADMSKDHDHMEKVMKNAEALKVVGIVCPKPDTSASALKPGIGYTQALTRHIIEKAKDTPLVSEQLSHPDLNVFTGKPFSQEGSKLDFDFKDLVTIDGDAISSAVGMNIKDSAVVKLLEQYLQKVLDASKVDTTAAQQVFVAGLTELSHQMLTEAITDHGGTVRLTLEELTVMVNSFMEEKSAQERVSSICSTYNLEPKALTDTYKALMIGLISEQITVDAPSVPKPAPSGRKEPSQAPTAGSESLPAASAPRKTQAPEFTIPPLTLPALPEDVTLPDVTLPDVTLPDVTLPDVTLPDVTLPDVTLPDATMPDVTMPDVTLPDVTVPVTQPSINAEDFVVILDGNKAQMLVNSFPQNPIVTAVAPIIATKMMEPAILENVRSQAAGFSNALSDYFRRSFHVDGEKLAEAFHFNMDEEELKRLVEAMGPQSREQSQKANLQLLGYADLQKPDTICLYMPDFKAKETFINFLEDYNRQMKDQGKQDKIIRYVDMAAMMMDSVRIIIATVSYCLIAFVGVSLVVSSIMIGIITYISVMERTKEIGVLRAMGASKRNISQVFNAETFIIGLAAGILGIAVSLMLLVPGNMIIHKLMGEHAITARLPVISALILIFISMLLTVLGGLIPAHQAAKKDPVIALRSE